MTDAVVSPSLIDGAAFALPPQARRPRPWRRLVLTAMSVVAFIAALVGGELGMIALIPLGGLLLAFSVDLDEETARRSVILSKRNLVLATAMTAAFGWFWLWHEDLGEAMLVVIASVLIALPLGLQESATEETRARTVVVTKRSLILALAGLVTFVYVSRDGVGLWFVVLAVICVVIPLVLAASRIWGARRGRIELGLLRHPLRREVRLHWVQALNLWLCCALLAGMVAAGGAHYARIGLSLNVAQFRVVMAAFGGGLLLVALMALVPRRRVYVATNIVVALLSGFLAVQLMHMAGPSTGAIEVDSPLAGEWFVQNGGRSALINGHAAGETHAVDFQQMGANGRTHAGGSGAALADYTGFGMPVLAPADGRVIEVTDTYRDNPPGTNSDYANHMVIDIGGGRFVALAHLQNGSVTVEVGDNVRRGQQIAAVGNNGHSSAPHLHFQVQDTTAASDAERTYPMVFRNVHITRGGAWPWGDSRELRTGDTVRPAAQ